METRACGRVRGEGEACTAAGMNCVAAIAVLQAETSCRAGGTKPLVYLVAIRALMKALLSQGCVEHACAALIAVMIVLLHVACSQLQVADIAAATAALRGCRGGTARPCEQGVSCVRAACVAGAHCVVCVWCRADARVCAKMCRELCGVGRVGGVRPRRFRVCVRGTPCGGRSRVRERMRSAACCGRAHLRGAPSAIRGNVASISFHRGGWILLIEIYPLIPLPH